MFSCKFYKIFKNTFFTEQLRVSASDNGMEVVVIYNLNLSLQFVEMNFTFSFLWVFTLAHDSTSPEFLHRYVYWWAYFKQRLARPLLKKIISKHNIHIFYNRLLGEVTASLELLMNFSYSVRIVLELKL